MPKADLHIHSRFSDRSAEWILRKLDFPDGVSDPKALHAGLRERGMDFVTITDHDRIEGCLEIAHLPGVFISEEVTARFPEDRCKVHLLVWGITEAQHREIHALRDNIYDLQRFLASNSLAHAVAHPLYRVDEKFGVTHIERLVLLFRHFEGVNGLRDSLFSDTARHVFSRLSQGRVEEFAARHGIGPTHDEPWRKVFIAGSDDHCGVFPAVAFTETPEAGDARDFLAHIRGGRCEARGKPGSPLAVSHGLYNAAYHYINERFFHGKSTGMGLVEKAFSRFMEGKDPTQFSWTEKLGFLAEGVASGRIFDLAKPAHASLWKEFAKYFKKTDVSKVLARETAGVDEPERRAFIIANRFANGIAFQLFKRFVTDVSSGNIIESLQHASTLAPVLLPLAPYLYAFNSQTPSQRWLVEVSRAIADEAPPFLRNEKRAWFTDTLDDVNGVANTIRKMAAAGADAGRDITVITSRAQPQDNGIPLKNFAPIGEFELPEYELQKLSFPPMLEMIDHIQRGRYTELVISTPGPVGLAAVFAAKMLGLRTSGIYHTDIPEYVRMLTDDSFLETLAWNYMHWFYSQFDVVYVNSEQYRRAWIDRGIPAEKLKILPRGLDTELFNPSRRDAGFLKKIGARDGLVTLLYVGRVSKEKNLDVLVTAFRRLRAEKLPVQIVVVGDGPYLAELRAALPGARFTGYLAGQELARAYASADVFAFPSATDTFGNVVIEALASGLPCVVSDQGGPRELVRDGGTGLVTRALDADAFADALARLVRDPELRGKMSRAARESVGNRDWPAAFEKFWAQTMTH
jgi:glycosyltransferase involved in cell wall biosynthesis